jgi:hypothetical protein
MMIVMMMMTTTPGAGSSTPCSTAAVIVDGEMAWVMTPPRLLRILEPFMPLLLKIQAWFYLLLILVLIMLFHHKILVHIMSLLQGARNMERHIPQIFSLRRIALSSVVEVIMVIVMAAMVDTAAMDCSHSSGGYSQNGQWNEHQRRTPLPRRSAACQPDSPTGA